MDQAMDMEYSDAQLEPRIFVLYNLTSGLTVSSAYGTVIVLAIAFAIAALGALLYYGLQSMASRRFAYGSDSYNYERLVM